VSVAEPLVQTSLLGEAIDHGPVAVAVADEEMQYVAVNQYAADLLGYTREELLKLTVRDVAVGPDVEAHYRQMVRQGHYEGTGVLRRKDGTELAVETRAAETRIAGLTFYVAVISPA
jgi:two-component system, sensor histidine kinase and response regulator